eukprot:GHVU01069149.1.p1 GENE.GHVU01069149.1~~GHVU01069149.1.p1  ORF type:complete len:126 (+),score=10.66 GHVU01069149.1:107-484(+)
MKFVLQFLASVCNCVRLFGLTKQARGEQAVEDRIRAEEYEVDRLLSPSPALKTDLPLGDESDDDSIAKPLSQVRVAELNRHSRIMRSLGCTLFLWWFQHCHKLRPGYWKTGTEKDGGGGFRDAWS